MSLRWLKTYPTLIKAYWARALQYRAQIFIWVLSSTLPLIMMMVWITIAQQNADGMVNGFSQLDFISYYLAVTFMRRMTGVWIIWDLDRDIRLGMLSPQLLRPIDPMHHYFVRSVIAIRPVQFMIIAPPVFLAMWLFGAQYDLRPLNILLMLLAAFSASLIEFFAQALIGMLAFWITQVISIVNAWFLLRALFSGWIIPIAMFPATIVTALMYLPFRYMLSFPVEIFLGNLTAAEIGLGFAIQWGWILILFVGYRLLWRTGLKHYSAVGA